jgi:hypothetical protein
MLEPNKVHERKDKLMGFEDADEMSGTLSWSVAYYDKAKLNPDLKMAPGIDHNLPKELQDRDELKVETMAIDSAEEADVTRTPPDPKFPSGVLSIIVHQINNLERQNLKGASGSEREGQAGQDTDAPEEEEDNIPSSYCEFVLNDDLIYKTRCVSTLLEGLRVWLTFVDGAESSSTRRCRSSKLVPRCLFTIGKLQSFVSSFAVRFPLFPLPSAPD